VDPGWGSACFYPAGLLTAIVYKRRIQRFRTEIKSQTSRV
jgi:hypothetical protein